MRTKESYIEAFFLFGVPGILGVAALILGLYLLTKKRTAPRPVLTSIFAWLLIAAFFGVGTCYALVFNMDFGG